MRRWLKRLALVVGIVVLLVAGAIGLAIVSTTPPEGYSKTPPPAATTLRGQGPIRAGAAAVEITPEKPVGALLAGFGLSRRATGVHDPLFARALALDVGGTKVALVVLDLIGLQAHHAARVRERLAARVPAAGVLVLATHDHSAPDTLGMWGPHPFTSGIDPAYLDRVLDAAVAAATKALDGLRPARLKVSRAQAPAAGISKNKRDPDVIDRDLLVLALDDASDGKAIATAVAFACHPEVLMSENHEITADFPGALVRELERKRGGTGVFLNGPLGGMVTPDVTAHTFAECDRVGGELARLALASLDDPNAVSIAEGKLGWVHEPIVVPIQNRRYLLARRIGVFDRPFEGGGHVTSEVNALVLGPLGLASVPGEALPALGFDVKTAIPTPFKAVLGLGGDELGYLIPEDAWKDETRYRYEKTVSPGPLATTLVRGEAIAAATAAADAAR